LKLEGKNNVQQQKVTRKLYNLVSFSFYDVFVELPKRKKFPVEFTKKYSDGESNPDLSSVNALY
jgi:hypothetical protein